MAATTSDGSLFDVTGGPTLEEIREKIVHEVTPIIYVDFVQESSGHTDVIGHASLILQDWKFDGLNLVDVTFSSDSYSYRIYMLGGRLIKTLMPVLPPVPEGEIAAYTIRATYNAQTDAYTVTNAPTLAELWEVKYSNDKTIVITLDLDNGANVYTSSDIQFWDVENENPDSCRISFAGEEAGFYQLYGASTGWELHLVWFTDVTALNAPATQGTAGQVLGLDENLSPTWVNQPESVVVDSELSTTSENPVQNKVITGTIRPHSVANLTPNTGDFDLATPREVGHELIDGRNVHFYYYSDSNTLVGKTTLLWYVSHYVYGIIGDREYFLTGDIDNGTWSIKPIQNNLVVDLSRDDDGVITANHPYNEIARSCVECWDYFNVYHLYSAVPDPALPEPHPSKLVFARIEVGNGAITIHKRTVNYLSKWTESSETINIPSLSGYATEQWVQDQGYLTQHQSLAAYQTKAITDAGGYFTTDTVEGALQEIGAELAGKADKTPRIAMTGADTAPTLDPNKLYVFPEMASLSPTFTAPSDNTIVNEYHFIFESGATATVLTLPASVLQPDGFTVDANMRYEVSILENCMTAQGWAVSAS